MNDETRETQVAVETGHAEALARLLGLDADGVREGDLLRPMWQVALLARWPRGALGPDGHGVHEPPTPPGPGLRRMFAGGRLTMRPGIHLGEEVSIGTAVSGRRTTQGRSGQVHFVTTRTTVSADGEVVLEDERDIVYLSAGPRAVPPVRPHASVVEGRRIEVDPVLLFRFSALTCNAHRIHYDADYCRAVEGYPGLVVHGPLQALLLAEEATTHLVGPLGTALPPQLHFDYRLVAPLFADQGLVIGVHGGSSGSDRSGAVEVEVNDDTGRTTATGRLAIARPEG